MKHKNATASAPSQSTSPCCIRTSIRAGVLTAFFHSLCCTSCDPEDLPTRVTSSRATIGCGGGKQKCRSHSPTHFAPPLSDPGDLHLIARFRKLHKSLRVRQLHHPNHPNQGKQGWCKPSLSMRLGLACISGSLCCR